MMLQSNDNRWIECTFKQGTEEVRVASWNEFKSAIVGVHTKEKSNISGLVDNRMEVGMVAKFRSQQKMG